LISKFSTTTTTTTTTTTKGWIPRFYVDRTVPPSVVAKLKDLQAEVIMQTELDPATGEAIRGMFWRFLVADDPTVDR